MKWRYWHWRDYGNGWELESRPEGYTESKRPEPGDFRSWDILIWSDTLIIATQEEWLLVMVPDA